MQHIVSPRPSLHWLGLGALAGIASFAGNAVVQSKGDVLWALGVTATGPEVAAPSTGPRLRSATTDRPDVRLERKVRIVLRSPYGD